MFSAQLRETLIFVCRLEGSSAQTLQQMRDGQDSASESGGGPNVHEYQIVEV